AAAAVGLAFAGQALLPKLLPEQILRFGVPTLDGRVLAFTLTVALLTTLLFGLLPAIRSTRGGTGGGDVSMVALSRSGPQVRWLRSSLTVGQMALACVLLILCGLVVRSLQKISQLDPGFGVAGVLSIQALPPDDVYETPEKLVEYYRQVDELIAGIPGVEAVGSVARAPFSGSGNIWSIEVEGQPVANIGEAPSAQVQQITPGALDALRIPLLAGRSFNPRDVAESSPAVIVNQSFADRFWPGKDAVGKRFRVFNSEALWMTVVGVVGTVRDGRPDQEGRSQWYVPHAQAFKTAWISPRVMTLLVRTSLEEPTDLAPLVLSRLKELDDRVALVDPSSLLAGLSRTLALPRQMVAWLAIFAVVALSLAALGLYGTLSYLVALRRSEIGIRMALGAEPRGILFGVLGEGLVLCAVGLALGVAGGAAMARAIR
ncbi:MAG: ABC transporter permease, partial [Acidobacteriota bacterium]